MTESDQEILYKALGKRIRQRREAVKITQGKFAEYLGLSRASIVNIEMGRQNPSLHLLLDMARILDLSYFDLLNPAIEVLGSGDVDDRLSFWKTKITQSGGNKQTKNKLEQFLIEVTQNVHNVSKKD